MVSPVLSLADAAADADRVVNCTGVGARELVGDPAVHPVWGQQVVVRNRASRSISSSWAPLPRSPRICHTVIVCCSAGYRWSTSGAGHRRARSRPGSCTVAPNSNPRWPGWRSGTRSSGYDPDGTPSAWMSRTIKARGSCTATDIPVAGSPCPGDVPSKPRNWRFRTDSVPSGSRGHSWEASITESISCAMETSACVIPPWECEMQEKVSLRHLMSMSG